jgi:hypothetical protein
MAVSFLKKLMLCLLISATLEGIASAQLRKRLHFTINAPYRIRMANVVLPEGRYTIQQVSENDLNLFFLFEGDNVRSPVAAIRTVSNGSTARWPDRVAVHWRIDERELNTLPIITGWDIPGYTGWEIISVAPRRDRIENLSRAR